MSTITAPNNPSSAISVDVAEIQRIFELQVEHQFKVADSTFRERKAKIKRLKDAIIENRAALHQALHADFAKPPVESDIFDLYPAVSEAKHALTHLSKWMQPQKVGTPTGLAGSSSYIQYEPKGVVLIIAPWNVPINLTFGPLVGAVAAGNCAIIKPSEITPHTSALIAEIINNIFDENEVTVIQGGVETSTALLKLPFNHIFFTGSSHVGKIVMKAAAEHLTSVTLELGGKSPTIIDETANLNEAATKIVWSKYSNLGQTCIAPDYLIVHEKQKKRLIHLLIQKIKEMYGQTLQDREASSDLTRMVNPRNYDRVANMLGDAVEKGAKIELGGSTNAADRFIDTTILTNVNEEMTVMQEEIFGPLLPIITYKDRSEVIKIINNKPKPLALYVFSKQKSSREYIIKHTRAGTTCINDCTVHYTNPNLPFGGSNNSGIGKAHGFYSFEAFSNARSVLKQHTPFSAVQTMLPPYNNSVRKMVDLLLKWF